MRTTNLALAFLVEFVAFAAFAVWGSSLGDGAARILAAIAAPAVVVVLWAIYAAPRSARRLGPRPRLAFEVGVFGLAVAAYAAAGLPVVAVAFGAVAIANVVLLHALGQWEADE
jgi:hypothetical protein